VFGRSATQGGQLSLSSTLSGFERHCFVGNWSLTTLRANCAKKQWLQSNESFATDLINVGPVRISKVNNFRLRSFSTAIAKHFCRHCREQLVQKPVPSTSALFPLSLSKRGKTTFDCLRFERRLQNIVADTHASIFAKNQYPRFPFYSLFPSEARLNAMRIIITYKCELSHSSTTSVSSANGGKRLQTPF
jgi:hypothetical protein